MKLILSTLAWSFLALPILAGKGQSKSQQSDSPEASWIRQSTNANDVFPFVHANYSQEELVEVRLAWAHQEHRLRIFQWDARHVAATNGIVHYGTGDSYVATINENDRTITTRIHENKLVRLSYEDFSQLLRDDTIASLADKRLQEIHEQSVKPLVNFVYGLKQ